MRNLLFTVAALCPSIAIGQVSNSASKADVQAVQLQVATLRSTAVTTVNGVTPTNGVVNLTLPAAASVDLSAYVKTVNGTAPTAGAVTIPTATFINGFTNTSPGTLSSLYSTAPCNASRVNQFATISDLYGGVTETMRCTYFGASFGYQWRAQRADFAAVISVGSSLTISCNVTPPSLNLQGTLTAGMTVAFTSANCTPGQRQEIQNGAVLGVYNVTATGLVGTATSKVLAGASTSLFIYDTAGWRAY